MNTVKLMFKGLRMDGGGWIVGGSLLRFSDENVNEAYIPGSKEGCNVTWEMLSGNITGIRDTVIYKVYPESVCRYTGRNDQNGTPIFEHDICVYGSCGFRMEILWEEDHSCYVMDRVNRELEPYTVSLGIASSDSLVVVDDKPERLIRGRDMPEPMFDGEVAEP